jgi:hypothetical protein
MYQALHRWLAIMEFKELHHEMLLGNIKVLFLQQAGVTMDKMTLAREILKVPFKKDGLHGGPHQGFFGYIYL